jgi:2-amino-4-hydroxy-6-hydroxymethyldihydropteridine diphosphokinase
MTSHQVYLGLGSNLGDREGNIRKAIALLHERVGEVVRQSSLIETVPWGFESEHRFLNGVILCETTLTPRQVLKATQKIERELGKTKAHATKRQLSMSNSQFPTFKDRPIDIDILLYDDWKVEEPDLKIPHPLMRERDFVMIPLKEIL